VANKELQHSRGSPRVEATRRAAQQTNGHAKSEMQKESLCKGRTPDLREGRQAFNQLT